MLSCHPQMQMGRPFSKVLVEWGKVSGLRESFRVESLGRVNESTCYRFMGFQFCPMFFASMSLI